MTNKVFIPLLLVFLLAISCKKDPPPPKIDDSKNLHFKATGSAGTPLNIMINIIRPATDGSGVNVQLVYISLNNIITPYDYTVSKLQTGDQVDIEVTTTKTKPITASLAINSVTSPATTVNLNNTAGVSASSWVYTIQ